MTVCRHEVQLLVPLGRPAVQDGMQARQCVGMKYSCWFHRGILQFRTGCRQDGVSA